MHSLIPKFLILLLVLHLCFHVLVPVSAKVFLSIDCGYSSLESYTDKNSIKWVGDQQYIQTGETRNVVGTTIEDRPWNTVREFTTRKKNCYSINVFNNKSEDSTKVERVLVRASFYYGNFDNEGTPPTFNLQFNGNNWSQVVTSMNYTTYEEVVFSLNHGNNISVCLAQTQRSHFPFISSLEIRSLDSDMYSYVDSNYPLIFMLRKQYGTSTMVRFPVDSYDRMWRSSATPSNSSGLVRVRNTSPSIKVDIADKVPEALFTTALMLKNISGTLYFGDDIKNLGVPMHFNTYFSEVMKLNSTQKRSFNITVYAFDDKDHFIFKQFGPVIPPYGDTLQFRIKDVTVESYSQWEIDLGATKDSNLPPLINAVEAYIIGDKLVQGTNSDDVSSLAILQKSFNQLQDWQGDPCLPSPFTWDWVACDSDIDAPRIIALYLNNLGLVGTLPDFSAMDALETIDLNGNSLTQQIPEFLGTLPKLKELNLTDNNFSGAIPSSILNNKNLLLSVSGNPNLTNNKNSTQPMKPSSSNKNSISSTILIVVFGSAIVKVHDYMFGL